MKSYDVIVAGAGHNGLVCATALAKAGRKVLLVEAAGDIGGAARTEEFHPGFRVSSVAHVLNRLSPEVVRELDLARHGLSFDRADLIPTVALARHGSPLVMHGAYGEVLTGAEPSEQSAWKELRAQLLRHAGVLKPFLARRPPALGALAFADQAALAKAGLALKRLGREDMRDFLRMLLMNVADVLDEHLADDRLKGVLAFDAVLGAKIGPRSPTSLLGLYYRLAGEAAGAAGGQLVPKGGMGKVAEAMASAAESAGVTIRLGSPVHKFLVENGRVSGIRLENAEEILVRDVVSALNPSTTFLELVGAPNLDTGFVRKVKAIRMQGVAAKLNLALDREPEFAHVDRAGHRGRLVIAGSTDRVERAFNPAKYGEFSPDPVMEITLPSLSDPSLAPDGACVLSAVIQFAPYHLREGWESGKPKFFKAVMAQLEHHAPGIGKLVRHAELLTPADIEARYRMPGGHWHHGELQADQMLMSRPVAGWSGYDTPIAGLWLAGAGSHPGGGISGQAGLNAARAVIAAKG